MNLLDAVAAVRNRNRITLNEALDAERRAVLRATADKSFLPEHHWQERHRLQRRQQALDTLLEISIEDAGL